jgi:hypothetical protein
MLVGMIEIETRRMIFRDLEHILLLLTRPDDDLRRHRVGSAQRLEDMRQHVQAMHVKIGRIQSVRDVVIPAPL